MLSYTCGTVICVGVLRACGCWSSCTKLSPTSGGSSGSKLLAVSFSVFLSGQLIATAGLQAERFLCIGSCAQRCFAWTASLQLKKGLGGTIQRRPQRPMYDADSPSCGCTRPQLRSFVLLVSMH